MIDMGRLPTSDGRRSGGVIDRSISPWQNRVFNSSTLALPRVRLHTWAMVLPPTTRYARRGGLSIAYQQYGQGPKNVVVVVDQPSHLDLIWLEPDTAGIARRLGSFARVLAFDRPGLGLSDPVAEVPTVEDQAADLRAVLDDAAVRRATVFCTTMSACGVALFAAQAPERIDGLMLWGPWSQGPLAAPEDQLVGWDGGAAVSLTAWRDVIEHWGSGRSLGFYFPGLAQGRLLRAWAMLERASAGPAMARAISEANLATDTRRVLPSITAPTIVLHHADAPVPLGVAQHVVELIPNARLVRLPPSTEATGLASLLAPALDHLEELVTHAHHRAGDRDRVLATLLFTDVVGSTALAAEIGDADWKELLAEHQQLVRDHVETAGGRLIDVVGDGSLSAFDGPARAIRCAQGICEAAPTLGVTVRAGLHTGECERVGDTLAGLAVHIGARVGAAAGAGEVWVSRTVRDLVAGSGLDLLARGMHQLKGVPGTWELFSLADGATKAQSVPQGGVRLKATDRIALAAARHVPGLIIAANRLGDRSRRKSANVLAP